MKPNQVSSRICHVIRERVGDKTTKELANQFDITEVAVRYHLDGECDHSVSTPPRKFVRESDKWVKDEEAYCSTCGYTFDSPTDHYFHQEEVH